MKLEEEDEDEGEGKGDVHDVNDACLVVFKRAKERGAEVERD